MIRSHLVALAALPVYVGCGATSDGFGRVDGDFTVVGCTAGEDTKFPTYEFTAQHVVTKRLVDHLEIVLLEFPVDLEETDGLVIQVESVTELRAAWAQVDPGPLTLPVGAGGSPVRAALSLFSTCPRAPTLQVVAGTLTFTHLALAASPADTGDGELVTGTITASVAGPDRERMLGSFSARFDFEPQNAPLLTPR